MVYTGMGAFTNYGDNRRLLDGTKNFNTAVSHIIVKEFLHTDVNRG